MAGTQQRLEPTSQQYGTVEPDPSSFEHTVRRRPPCAHCWESFMALFRCSNGLSIFPIVLIILFPTTFLVSYLIAVLNGHVEPDFPYISDTGAQSPESCIFGQLLNICSVFALINIYLKYRHVTEHYQFGGLAIVRANTVCLVLGIISSLGASLVANFQETNVLTVHMIGAVMAFGIGTVYCWVMSFITYRLTRFVDTRCLFITRIVISAFATITFVTSFVFAALAGRDYHGSDKRKWYPNDGGWAFHVVSTASEWGMAAAILSYFGTFIADFRKMGARAPEVFIIDEEEVDFISRAQDSDRLADDVA